MNEDIFIPLEKADLKTESTPELLIIAEEAFTALSDEAKKMVDLINKAPDYLFKESGVLKKIRFQKFCKRRAGWTPEKVEDIKFELGLFCAFAVHRREKRSGYKNTK